ncbi:MAG: hypothetical protein K2X99_00690 [Gemmatimonadaceae bacterium]|nr:hypothetical protein [Gemmatimonadaceae bacterium]
MNPRDDRGLQTDARLDRIAVGAVYSAALAMLVATAIRFATAPVAAHSIWSAAVWYVKATTLAVPGTFVLTRLLGGAREAVSLSRDVPIDAWLLALNIALLLPTDAVLRAHGDPLVGTTMAWYVLPNLSLVLYRLWETLSTSEKH